MDLAQVYFSIYNEILRTQHQLQAVTEMKLYHTKAATAQTIYDRHIAVAGMMADTMKAIRENCAADESIQNTFDDIDRLLDELED